MERFVALVSRAFAVLACTCVALLMIGMVADVARRVVTGTSIAGVVEVSELLMVGIVFLGISYSQVEGRHVAVTLFADRMPPRVGAGVRAFAALVLLTLVAWMTWRTFGQAVQSYRTGETRWGLLRVVVWPARFAIPVGLGLLTLQVLVELRRHIAAVRAPIASTSGPDEPEDVLDRVGL